MLMEREIQELEDELGRAQKALSEAIASGRLEDPDRALTEEGGPKLLARIREAEGSPQREEPIRLAAVGVYQRQLVFVDNRVGLGVPMFAITAVACRMAAEWLVRARAMASKPPADDRRPRVSVRV